MAVTERRRGNEAGTAVCFGVVCFGMQETRRNRKHRKTCPPRSHWSKLRTAVVGPFKANLLCVALHDQLIYDQAL